MLKDLLNQINLSGLITEKTEVPSEIFGGNGSPVGSTPDKTIYEFEAGDLHGSFTILYRKEMRADEKKAYKLEIAGPKGAGVGKWGTVAFEDKKAITGGTAYALDDYNGGAVFVADDEKSIRLGHINYCKILTLDLENLTNRQVIAALQEAEGDIWDSLSLQAPDRLHWTTEGYDMKFFEGLEVPHWIAVYCVTGTSEGIYIHVDFIGEKRHLKLLGKTFIGDMQACYESAGRIARLLGA